MELASQITARPEKRKTHAEWFVRVKLRAEFHSLFPRSLFAKGEPKKPLKIGIFEDIASACPDIPLWRVALLLKDYCTGPSYYAAIIRGEWRIDLNGVAVEPVTGDAIERARTCFSKFPLIVQKKWEART